VTTTAVPVRVVRRDEAPGPQGESRGEPPPAPLADRRPRRRSTPAKPSPTDHLRALVLARQLLDEKIAELVAECWRSGAERVGLSAALDVSRSGLYRHHGRGSQAPP
jgi:hypothetical protein